VPGVVLLALACGLLAGPAARPSIAGPDQIRFSELYGSFSPLGLSFSEVAVRLRGKAVVIRGYMAPPLKPDATFFVLTSQPVSLCPFCQSDADWPQDIAVVYLRKGAAIPFRTSADLVEVWGVLELGSKTDPTTGFVSQVRVVDATARRVSPAGV
jgi:hypothetical protein